MKTVYTEIANDLHKVCELQDGIRTEAAVYAAKEILKIEALIIKGDEPKAVQYMIDYILKITFEIAEVGVNMNFLAKVKRAQRKERGEG